MSTERKAWFCPSCQKHHAPHCDSCPEPLQVRPLPGVNVWPITVLPTTWEPEPDAKPWMPRYEPVTVSTARNPYSSVVMPCTRAN